MGAQRPPAATMLIINEEINCAERCLTREQPCDIALPSPFTPGAKLSSRPCRGGPGVSRQRTFHLDFGGKIRQAGRGAGAWAGWVTPRTRVPPSACPRGRPVPVGHPTLRSQLGPGEDADAERSSRRCLRCRDRLGPSGAGTFAVPRATVLWHSQPTRRGRRLHRGVKGKAKQSRLAIKKPQQSTEPRAGAQQRWMDYGSGHK